jgi:predicted Zn finger-like uncharacterized protein
MSIQVRCPNCNTAHRVTDKLAGRELRCPNCESKMQIPSAEEIQAARARRESSKINASRQADAAMAGVTAGDLHHSSYEDDLTNAQRRAKAWRTDDEASDEPIVAAAGGDGDEEEEEVEKFTIPKGMREEAEMDMTPMVDVTFLLLIFFMLTASFTFQKAFSVPTERSDEASTNAVPEEQDLSETVTVQVDENNSFTVLTASSADETPGKQSLIMLLNKAVEEIRGDRGPDADAKLIVQAHTDSKLQAVVDAIDAGAVAQFSEIQVQEVEEFD